MLSSGAHCYVLDINWASKQSTLSTHSLSDLLRRYARRAARVHVPPDGGAAEAADGGAEEEDE